MPVSRKTVRDLRRQSGYATRAPRATRPAPPQRPSASRITGLPHLEPHDLFSVAPDGTRIATAHDSSLQVFRLVHDREVGARAEALACVELPGRAAGLMYGSDGALYAYVTAGRGTLVVAVADDQIRTLHRLDAHVTSAAVTRTHVALAVSDEGPRGHRLVLLRRRDGRIARERPLTSARVRLRAGRGDEILVADSGARQLRTIDTSRAHDACRPSANGNTSTPRPSRPSGKGCGCGCTPCGCRRPHPPGHDGSAVPDPRPVPPRRDPDDQCIPGDDGEPDGCIVTYTFGALLVTVDICDPGGDACSTTLDHDIGSVHLTRRAVVATSADGRGTTVLDRATLRTVHRQRHRPGPRSAVISASVARDADLVFLRDGSGTVTLLDPSPVLPAPAAPTELAAPASSAVFLGASAGVSYDPNGRQIGTRRVLIVPALEPGQSFNPAGSTSNIATDPGVADILTQAQDYCHEATRHAPPDNNGIDVEFVWFGHDTPDLYTGPPITLPHPFKSYWGPAWDPGHIKSTVPLPPAGLTLTFSGDESLTLLATPSDLKSSMPQEFDIRFPAASYAARIPDTSSTITLGPGTLRVIDVAGDDRQGNPFLFTVDTGALPAPVAVDLVRMSLEAGSSVLDTLADVIQTMLDSAPGFSGLFERPRVLWHDDGEETGILHVSLSFAPGPGSSTPRVTTFALGGLLPLPGTSIPATFTIPGDEGTMSMYLQRNVTDASVILPDFGSDVLLSYFELREDRWKPTVKVEGGEMTVRISLSTNHGRAPAVITRQAQTGLESIGMDAPQEEKGADTKFSGGGGPMFDDSTLFDDAFTAMIDRTIAEHGAEEFAINRLNGFFNCTGIDGPVECSLETVHALIVTPVYPSFLGTGAEPDLVAGERANANRHETIDRKAAERAVPVLPFGGNRGTLVLFLAPDSLAEPDRGQGSASTLAHELGHGLLGLKDLYRSAGKRREVEYLGGHCLMADSGSFAHFCAYHQRVKGWLADDAILLLDRPGAGAPIDQEVVLLQLEGWDALLDEAGRVALAQSALPGMSPTTPVRAAAFLRLGGDGRQFDILELRGEGVRFSKGITPPRILISNAIDPMDDTRYATDEVEGAGTTRGVLERYRVKVHLLSSGLRAVGDLYDFGTSAEFPEVGLTAEVLEWGTFSTAVATFQAARVRIRWERGKAIDLGFVDSTPDWQSPDIAVIRPEAMDDAGEFDFPAGQNAPDEETFRVPADGEEPLLHKVAVRVWNFGDERAENVQVGLIRKHPGGSGDWKAEPDESQLLPEALQPSAPQVIAFDWPVSSELDTHVCFRAQIGDRDVPFENGVAIASDDTNASNDWAQQNAFILDAEASSPPDPVAFTFQVENEGSYREEVTLRPRGLGVGARVIVTPARLTIAPFSRGLFRVRVELEEHLLTARCGKDITFVLEAWRRDDDSEERWGGAKYTVRPRFRTQTVLQGGILPGKLQLSGSVTPDVGAQRVLLHVQRPGRPSIWEEVPLGPGATFDYEIVDEFPSGDEVRAVAYYDGSFEYAKSVSAPVILKWDVQG